LDEGGSVDVSRAMVENGIDFGGEENGGVMYGPHHPTRDGQ
jgi:phosphomannomutase